MQYRNKECEKGGRYFNGYDSLSLPLWLEKQDSLKLEKLWISQNLRIRREHEKWLNCLSRKALYPK